MSISAMKQALEALDSDDPSIQLRAAVALRQAIAEAEKQEPVAWIRNKAMWCTGELLMKSVGAETEIPLYTKREWVGLTYEEVKKIVDLNTDDDYGYDIWCNGRAVARDIEAKLKEKNT